jgi:serine/threonine protein kinase
MRTLPQHKKSFFEAYDLNQEKFFLLIDQALASELDQPEAKDISKYIHKNFSTLVKRAEHSGDCMYVARKEETHLARTVRISLLHGPEFHVVLKKVADGCVKRVKKVLVIKKNSFSTVAELGILKKTEIGERVDNDRKTFLQQDLDQEIAFMNRLSPRFSFISKHACLDVPNKDGVIRTKYHTELAEKDFYEQITSSSWVNESIQKKLSIIANLSRMVLDLHEGGICHLDIKPENVLMFKDGSIRLSDFGHAAEIGDRITCRGTPGCMAPEMFKRYKVPAHPSMDMWSLGVLVWCMFKKDDNPFGSVQKGVVKRIRHGFKYTSKSLVDKIIELKNELSVQERDLYLKKVYKLISKLLLIDPIQRLTDVEFVKRVNAIQASLAKS